jgi:hypothetical protein
VSKNNVVTSLANEVLPERICRIRSRVYVAAQDGVIGAIDLHSIRKLPEIKLPGHPEAFAIEAGGHCLFVNVPKTHSVFVIAYLVKISFVPAIRRTVASESEITRTAKRLLPKCEPAMPPMIAAAARIRPRGGTECTFVK